MAVTATITLTNPDAAIVAAMVGDDMGLTVQGTNTPRAATTAELKTWLAALLVARCKVYNRRLAQQALADAADVVPVVT